MPTGVYIRTEEYRNKFKDIIRYKISRTLLAKNIKKRAFCLNCGKEISYRAKKCKFHIMKGKPWSEARRKSQKPNPFIMNNKKYHPNWNEIRKQIYKRDNWVCQECGEKCHNEIKIQCHHIDYDINNNNLTNLITLCNSCHFKTNYKRSDWTSYFRDRFLLTFPSKEEKVSQETKNPVYLTEKG